ncbi:MAG: aconitase family protein, partial [Kiritimatiellae bacterium]|nr:aconitase family protein [Kiritimatiellia bacterium]
ASDVYKRQERMTICNMAVEAGAKNGIIPPDKKALDYVTARTSRPFTPLWGDEDAPVAGQWHYNAESFVPLVATPPLPSNCMAAHELAHVKLDRAYVGSCTGGKLSDFLMVARILKGRQVKIPTFLVPATTEVAEGLITETLGGKSLVEIFAEAGCEDIAPPSCAACLGGPPDTYGRTQTNEVVISTTNRNFVGRMGSKDASIYLASPLTVAASAVTGRITDPRDLL